MLDKPEFAVWAEKYCVPVEIDVPNNAALVGGERQKRLNKFICDEYGVQSFPTLKVMTPEMVAVGGYSGAPTSPGAAIAALEKCFDAAKRLQAALKKDGAARTQALADIYGKLSETERLNCLNREWENQEPGNEDALRRLKGQLLREQALQKSRHAQSVAEIIAARDAMIQSLEYTDSPQERSQLQQFIHTYYADPEALFLKQQKNR